jgi:hypothetical protein
MFALIARLAQLLRAPANDGGAVANRLLASADRRAGRNPRHARELRRAALASLRVVR